MESMDALAMLMHLMEKDDNDSIHAMFLPTIATNTTNRPSTHRSMMWKYLQHTSPFRVQPFSQVNYI